ncbi:polysaccharide deacetylase family protein [candidate division KSB1 bacterium]|nr:polysaccharide deacetylase family protein [candidate division KSB1 bacterium]
MPNMQVQTSLWKFGKKFAYSVTYDEGLEDLLKHTLPVHQKFNIPGCVAVVVSQVGLRRNLPTSSYHGMMHMNVSQLHEIMKLGWSVANHSMTHGYMKDNPEMEVVESKHKLEDMLGVPITSFIVPNHNDHHPPVVPYAKKSGYLSVYTITDAVNTYQTDRFALNRTTMVQKGFPPFFNAFDPYHRLHQALECNGWIVEYSHLTNPENISPEKDLKQADLIRRFEKLEEVAPDGYWAANPVDVVDYMLVNHSSNISGIRAAENEISFSYSLNNLPEEVAKKDITLQLVSDIKSRGLQIFLNGIDITKKVNIRTTDSKLWFLTLTAEDTMNLQIKFM